MVIYVNVKLGKIYGLQFLEFVVMMGRKPHVRHCKCRPDQDEARSFWRDSVHHIFPLYISRSCLRNWMTFFGATGRQKRLPSLSNPSILSTSIARDLIQCGCNCDKASVAVAKRQSRATTHYCESGVDDIQLWFQPMPPWRDCCMRVNIRSQYAWWLLSSCKLWLYKLLEGNVILSEALGIGNWWAWSNPFSVPNDANIDPSVSLEAIDIFDSLSASEGCVPASSDSFLVGCEAARLGGFCFLVLCSARAPFTVSWWNAFPAAILPLSRLLSFSVRRRNAWLTFLYAVSSSTSSHSWEPLPFETFRMNLAPFAFNSLSTCLMIFVLSDRCAVRYSSR